MLNYNLDIDENSIWKRTTPTEFTLGQPYYCTEAGIFYAGTSFNTLRDYKDSYLLFYTVKGAGIIEQNGTKIKLTEGNALLLDCRTMQTYYTDPESKEWVHYWIHINGSGIIACENLLFNDKKPFSTPVHKTLMTEKFNIVLQLIDDTSSTNVLSLSLCIHEMINELMITKSHSISKNEALINETVLFIKDHYNEKINTADLLKLAHMSKTYYMRLFKQYMGTTPYNYNLSLRITKAKEYLETSEMSIHEIALETGFNDDTTFSTRFTSMVGISPLKYRNSAITRMQR
ncbi:MAG: AraC family transcriptional regulator [Lachnospiraceae bacterium]|nr:AraC family transcriptional regulator [Lachnospiraceae bacterium]